MICDLGFVSLQQLNMLYSVIRRYPAQLSRSILAKWCQFSGLLLKHRMPKTNSLSAITIPVYIPTKGCRSFLKTQGISLSSDSNVSVNSHNLQSIEVVVQAIYAATFKCSLYATSNNYFLFDDISALLIDPDSSIKVINPEINYQTRYQKLLKQQISENYIQNDRAHSLIQKREPEIQTRNKMNSTLTFREQEWLTKYYEILSNIDVTDTNTLISLSMKILLDSLIDGGINNTLLSKLKNNINLSHEEANDLLKNNFDRNTINANIAIKDKTEKSKKQISNTYKLKYENNGQKFLDFILSSNEPKQNCISKAENNRKMYDNNGKETQINQNETKLNYVKVCKCHTNNHTLQNKSRISSNENISKLSKNKKTRYKLITSISSYKLLYSAGQSCSVQQNSYRYPLAKIDNIGRNLNLISNPQININKFDFSSFKNQYNYHQYTFVADQVISFTRHGRRQEIFIELDNRTEGNDTQIQKILNYISYALDHPQRDVLLVMAITDGSLYSKRIPKYTNIGRKLGSLSSKFLMSFLKDTKEKKFFLYQMYKQANNLKIALTGVSEAHIDISQFILGSNYSLDYLNSINQYICQLSENTEWNVSFKPSNEFKTILQNQELLNSSLNDLKIEYKKNSQGNGIWRYINTSSFSPFLGRLKIKHKLERKEFYQPIIAGDEHSLDTIIKTYEQIYSTKKDSNVCPPMILYPTRERPVTAITLNQYRKLYKWTSTWNPTIPVLVQPRTSINNNVQLHRELRWLTLQFDLDIYNYFKIGAVNKAALRQYPDYGHNFVKPLKWSIGSKPRSYANLHKLAIRLNKKEFIDQLRLSEVPLGLFKLLLSRWPKGQYSLPLISHLDYWDNTQCINNRPILSENIFNHVYGLNAITPNARTKLTLPKLEI